MARIKILAQKRREAQAEHGRARGGMADIPVSGQSPMPFELSFCSLRPGAHKFLMQPGVNSVLVQQAFMRAALDNSPLIQHQN